MVSVEQELKALMENHLDLKVDAASIHIDDPIAELGIDSFTFVKLITVIEVRFGIEFDENDLVVKNFLTFGSLLRHIENKIKLL